ncbi:MAG: thioredoxin family protein [Myxococcales bacterium]|nr:thioredoxin family protein [Myxococcales bacterium]MCB9690950.1 thioredoxin family protein [Alphaproteobacteria bacterium]
MTLEQTLAAHRTVVAAFGSPWCAPCRALEHALERELPEGSPVAHVHVDITASPDTALAYRITATPTLVGFVDGRPVLTRVGFSSVQGLRSFLGDLERVSSSGAERPHRR